MHRQQNLVPGTPLNPERQDDRVPLLIIRRTLEAPEAESQSINGYTLLLPAGWGMAFWSSLTYAGTRVGGQRERQTQAYEAGVPYFPRDFPCSSAYEKYADEKEIEERESWTKIPPAKRVNYQKLGVRSPWRADWEIVLGLKEAGSPSDTGMEDAQDFVPTQRDDRMDVDQNDTEIGDANATVDASMDVDEFKLKPWLFRGSEVKKLLANLRTDLTTNLLKEINRLRQKRFLEPLNSSINPDEFLKHALINVKVIMFREGVPEDMAMIYQVSDDEAMNWEGLVRAHAERSGPSLLQVSSSRVRLHLSGNNVFFVAGK
jgi:ribonuclease P/MRP protein subunit POP1